MDFRTAMLAKAPYPSFNQFVLAFQGHEQTLASHREEEKIYINHAQALFSQRGRRRNGRGGRFNSRGRGFTPAGRYNNGQNIAAQPNHTSNQQPKNQGYQPKQENQSQQHLNNSNNSGKTICQICGKTNHLAIDC